jgi:hypothetical protein
MYYTYCYFNPLKNSKLHECGFEPFYIGKGKNNRLHDHLSKSSIDRDRNKHKVNTLKQIIAANLNPLVIIIANFENEIDAFNEEIRLIKLWGRRDLNLGPLTNMTDGGEGSSNKIFSTEYRKKLSAGTKRAYAAGLLDSNIKAFKYSKLGKKDSEETIRKRIESRINSGYIVSVETKLKMSIAQNKVRKTESWKIKASLSQLGKKHTQDHTNKSIIGNPKSRPIELFGEKYLSIGQAIKMTGLTPGQIRKHPTLKFL